MKTVLIVVAGFLVAVVLACAGIVWLRYLYLSFLSVVGRSAAFI